ncbi:MAG TPA: hypothetical protein VG321_06040 [Solirubrobacteraceae bacterium]|nr:hypothetical protein [Solirubrobacteraceae bacterium]
MVAEEENVWEAFARLASGLPGELVVAVAPWPDRGALVLGEDRPFHAWSTIKVPILVALLTLVHREALTPEHRELARLAITESDNSAILELFVLLEGLAGGSTGAAGVLERLFRLSNDDRTAVTLAPPPPGAITPFGQVGWRAADSVRFFAALAGGRLLSAADTRYVLDLMAQVIPEQRWGLGRLREPVAFKGGWGPEADGTCLVRQSGVVFRDGATAVSFVAVPPPGEESFDVGVGMVSQAAEWIAGVIGV